MLSRLSCSNERKASSNIEFANDTQKDPLAPTRPPKRIFLDPLPRIVQDEDAEIFTEPQATDYDMLFKIAIGGDCNAGKTRLLERFCNNTFTENPQVTIDVEFCTKIVTL